MSTSTLRFHYRAYPGHVERQALSRTFGSCRVVYNDAVAAREAAHRAGQPFPKTSELSRRLITEAKLTPERAWLGEVSAVALQQTLIDVDSAYRNFFYSLKGERRGKKVGHPKFRSRHDGRQSARFTRNARFRVRQVHEKRAVVVLPKVGEVPFVLSRPLPSEPTSVTVVREADGRFYVSFVVEVQNEQAPETSRACGIDVGLSTFATVLSETSSTGEADLAKLENPLYLRRRARALARSQRALARKKKGSRNRDKQRQKVAALHRRVREARADHAHQQAARIVAAHDVICVEDLNLSGLAGTRLAKSVLDAGHGQFLRLVKEKAERQGRQFIKVDRFFPSTQICFDCKAQTGPKGKRNIEVRHWTCSECGASHDRDENAARNILAEGLRLLEEQTRTSVADGRSETQNACGASVSPPDSSEVAGIEAGRENSEAQRCAA